MQHCRNILLWKKKLIDLTDICPWKEKAHPQKQHLYYDKIEVPCFTSECEVPNGFFSLPKDYLPQYQICRQRVAIHKAYDTEFSRIFSVPILFPYRRLKKTLIGSRYSCVIKTSNLSTLRDYRYNRLHFTGTFEVYVKVALINLIFIATCKLFLNWARSKSFIFNHHSWTEEYIYLWLIMENKLCEENPKIHRKCKVR